VNGGSLKHLLQTKQISFMNKFSIALDIVSGMQFLSRSGIVHRDLAARNVLTKREGTVFVRRKTHTKKKI